MVEYFMLVKGEEAEEIGNRMESLGFKVKKYSIDDADENLTGITISNKEIPKKLKVEMEHEVIFDREIPLEDLIEIYKDIENKYHVQVRIIQKK